MKTGLITLLVFAASALYAAGQDSSPITVVAGEVTDTSSASSGPGSAEIIDVSDSDRKMTSVSEVLAERAGVQVKRYGGIGSRSSISIRGSNSNQVTIYIDGMPLADAKYGEVNLEDIPMDAIERIEVYKGFTPAGFGTSGIGGVINIVTRKSAKKEENALSATYGSYDTYKITARRSQKFSHARYLLSGTAAGSDGDYRYKNDNGTPVINTSDDYWTRRHNNKYRSYAGTGSFGYTLGKLDFLATDNLFYKNQGLPGLAGSVTENVGLKTVRNMASLKVNGSGLFSNACDAEGRIYASIKRDDLDDPDNELGTGTGSEKGYFSSFGGDTLWKWALYSFCPQIVKLNLTGSFETYHHRDTDIDDGSIDRSPSQRRLRGSAVLEDELLFMNGRLEVLPQLRFDAWRDSFVDEDDYSDGDWSREVRSGTEPGWQFGLRYFLIADRLYVRGNISHAVRVPTFTELFGDRGYIIGNQDLESERSLNREVGTGLTLGSAGKHVKNVKVELNVFSNVIYNNIIYIYNSQYTLKPQNVGRADINGFEISAAADLFSHLNLSANYTFQRAINHGDLPNYYGKYLPNRPVHEASGKAKFYINNFSVSYEVSYTGFNFLDAYNTESYFIDYRVIHNLEFEYFPVKGMSLDFEIKNLADSHISDVYGMPLPGRSFYLTAGYSWE